MDGASSNNQLISRGATPVANLREMNLSELSRHWKPSESEQLSMFDNL